MRGGLAPLGHNLMPNLADIPLHALHVATQMRFGPLAFQALASFGLLFLKKRRLYGHQPHLFAPACASYF